MPRSASRPTSTLPAPRLNPLSNSTADTRHFERSGISRTKSGRTFLLIWLLIAAVYGVWLLTFWPGVLGEDSLAVLLEIESNGSFQSGKTTLWYYFVKLFSGPDELVEIPISVQMLIASVIFSRILTWCLSNQMKKIFFFGLIFICLAPNMVFFIGLLYSDAIFSVCVIGLLFEIWLIANRRKISTTSLAIIIIALPFAGFARSNGVVFVLALLPLLIILKWPDGLKLVAVIGAWCLAVFAGNQLHKTYKHGVLYPLALFETVNFLQPRPMGLWEASPRVSDRTIQILTQKQPLSKILEYYDPDYWDPLIYRDDGPQLLALPIRQQKRIVKEFFRYNLWRNIPDFFSSRVNIFLVSSLAGGGFPGLEYSSHVLKRTHSQSEFRKMKMERIEPFLRALHESSFTFRWILWTPWLGIVLTGWLLLSGWRHRDVPILLVTVPMAALLGGIFLFSIAGEYRYLLPYFVLPLVLLPVLATQRRQARANAVK